MRRGIATRIALAAAGLALVAILPVVYAACLQLFGNMHTVIPGELYRSATLSPEQLSALIEKEVIRTIINLRGGETSHGWLRAEIAAAEARGATVVTLPWLRPPTMRGAAIAL